MVRGLDIFKEYFAPFKGEYILKGTTKESVLAELARMYGIDREV